MLSVCDQSTKLLFPMLFFSLIFAQIGVIVIAPLANFMYWLDSCIGRLLHLLILFFRVCEVVTNALQGSRHYFNAMYFLESRTRGCFYIFLPVLNSLPVLSVILTRFEIRAVGLFSTKGELIPGQLTFPLSPVYFVTLAKIL